MKSYAKKSVAAGQATKLSNLTGVKYIAVQDGDSWLVDTEQNVQAAFEAIQAAQPTAVVKVPRSKKVIVQAVFEYVGEDEKYLHINAFGKVIRLGKRLVTFAFQGTGEVVVSMSKKYAAHRKELQLQ